MCINIFSGNSIYCLIMGVNRVLDGMFYCMCSTCNACKVDIHPLNRWQINPDWICIYMYWMFISIGGVGGGGCLVEKNVLFMKVQDLHKLSILFCFCLHTCPPGRSGTLSIILYPSAITLVWKFYFLCRKGLYSSDKAGREFEPHPRSVFGGWRWFV